MINNLKPNSLKKIALNLLSISLLMCSFFLPLEGYRALFMAILAYISMLFSRLWDVNTLYCASSIKPKGILVQAFIGLFPAALAIFFLLYQSTFYAVAAFIPFFSLAIFILNNSLIPLFVRYEYNRELNKQGIYKRDGKGILLWRMIAFICGGVSERSEKNPFINFLSTLVGFAAIGIMTGTLMSGIMQQYFMHSKFVYNLMHLIPHVGGVASITIISSLVFVGLSLVLFGLLALSKFNRKCMLGDYHFKMIKNEITPIKTPHDYNGDYNAMAAINTPSEPSINSAPSTPTLFAHPVNDPNRKKRSPLQLINTLKGHVGCVDGQLVADALIHDRADITEGHFKLPSRQQMGGARGQYVQS